MPPINLNENENLMLEDSGFVEIFKEHGNQILEKIKSKNPETNYDVQEKSISIVRDLCDESFINPVKNYAYEKNITVEQVLYFGGIYARDKYFEKFGS